MARVPLRVGLVGCGHNGLAHGDCYQQHPRTALVAVCDLNEERRQAAAARFGGISAYARAADMLEQADLDLVTVNTPDPFHADP